MTSSERNDAQQYNLQGRVSRLEELFSQLADRLNGWTKDLKEELRLMTKSIADQKKTDWSVIFGALGIGFGLINMYVRPTALRTEWNEQAILEFRNEYNQRHQRVYDHLNDQAKRIDELVEKTAEMRGNSERLQRR